ncbi:unnamed protein product, partial [Brenthis ino]
MSSKKLKKSTWDKCHINTISGNNPEVLVLPPDILQKLGINLGNIESSKEITIKKENLKDRNNESKGSADKESIEKTCNIESSFLETANLMKESVLLSPTFHTMKHNSALNELKMVHTNKHENSFDIQQKDRKDLSNRNECEMHTLQFDIESDSVVEVTHNLNTEIRNQSEIIKEEIQTLNTNSKIRIKNTLSKSIETSSENVSKKVFDSNASESKNQINIISQEIIGIDSIAKIKYLTSPDRRHLIPVKIDTLLPSNKIHKSKEQRSCLSIPETISGASHITNVQSLDRPVKEQENNIVNTKSLSLESGENFNITQDPNVRITNEINKLSFNNTSNIEMEKSYQPEKSKSQINIMEEHVENNYNDRKTMLLNEENKEFDNIADCNEQKIYLNTSKVKDVEYQLVPAKNDDTLSSKSLVARNTKFDDSSSSSYHDIEELRDCKDKKINSEEKLITSKLCIQGVEKPGGEGKLVNKNVEIQCVRTYSRSKKPKSLNFNILKPDSLEKNLKYEDAENKQIDEISYLDIEQNFCLCNDFGRLSFYGYDANYEHIHFGERQPVCSLEVFSSIYEDNNMIEISEQDINNIENSTIELDNSVEHEYSHSSLFICFKDDKNLCENTNNDSTILCQKNKILQNQQITSEGTENDEHLINKKHIVAEKSNESDTPSRERNAINKSPKKRNNLDTSSSNRDQKEDLANESMKSAEIVTTSKKTKKRKISKTDSDHDKSNSKKACSDTISCGVCKQKVAIDEWKNHISSEHDFIAWAEGDTLDLEDKKLLRRLNNRLLETGKIICTFCDNEICALDEFIDHIKICMHRQLNPNHRIKCGVCQRTVEGCLWIEHICKEHYYLAWEDGEPPLDLTDSDKIMAFLNITSKAVGGLECTKCGLKRKFVKTYIRHLKKCANIKILPSDQVEDDEKVVDKSDENIIEESPKKPVIKTDDSVTEDNADDVTQKTELTSVVCGVCQADVETEKWIDHICMEHNYAAWKEGETAIDVNDIKQLSEHLYVLSKAQDGLTCAKCGLRRRYVKSFLNHIKTCDGTTHDSTLNELKKDDITIECGVCHQQMQEKRWFNHIQREHSYLAWKEGENPIDFTNDENVNNHLYAMSKKYDGLICNKCGLTRKYVKMFLAHIQSCESTSFLDYSNAGDGVNDDDTCECGVCGKVVDKKDWKSHAMKKHYNVAWAVGDYPIDVKNPNVVEKYLKEYRNLHKKLVCSLCGLLRASILGFYAHVLQCGKTEEEIDMFKNYCDICNSKYLCIYKNQHLSMHREQELSKERKLSFESKKLIVPKEEIERSEGRQAARKALNVIEKYKSYEYNCDVCGYGADDERELEEHNCGKLYRDTSDSEVSVKLEDSSSDDTEESGVDRYISDDVEIKRERKKRSNDTFSAASKIKRIPFDVRNPKLYLQQAGHEYVKAYLSNDLLYQQWRECKYEAIPEEQISKYMPPIEESCKLKLCKGDWTVFKKFEAKKDSAGYTIFVGSSIQCIAWAGAGAGAGAGRQLLAVAAHNAADTPRLGAGAHARANMLQIWDFAALDRSTPKFALGIAHDYGMVWGMDWCPSGTRDDLNENQTTFARLGLLAIACSDGHAYILCVPYPSTITDGDRKVYKLQPVAELRLCRTDREKFQATSISWSSETDHASVLVGYSDGTLALYDLQSESPILVHKIKEVSIFYPYYEERPHNTCVTGVATFPLKYSARSLLSSASPTGAECARRGGGARLRSALACSAARHAPHWPSVLLAENDSIVNQAVNELDWWCLGRRLGAVHSCGGCAHCGRLAAYAPPALRLMTPHPVYCDLNKETVAIIHMVPLSRKRSKQKNDDFGVKLEPLTYKDAVKSYGIEVRFAKELDKKQIQNLSNKEQCPERFPLADIPSMAFNPSAKHHKQLALATHSGFVFVINV